jgi:hypothetical protein
VRLSKKVLYRVSYLVVEVPLIVRLHLVDHIKLLIWMHLVKLCGVDSFDDNTVWDALTSGKTATVLLNDVHYVIGIKVMLLLSREDLVMFLTEGDDDAVLQIIKHFRIVAANELLQFFLEIWTWHLL